MVSNIQEVILMYNSVAGSSNASWVGRIGHGERRWESGGGGDSGDGCGWGKRGLLGKEELVGSL